MSYTGLLSSPKHPHIGYLLAHHPEAIAFMVLSGIVSEEDALLELQVAHCIDHL